LKEPNDGWSPPLALDWCELKTRLQNLKEERASAHFFCELDWAFVSRLMPHCPFGHTSGCKRIGVLVSMIV
jgi:hypothetical protein